MIKLTFNIARETKGAVRYHEVDDRGRERITDEDGAIVGLIYFRKRGLYEALDMDEPPKALTITVQT